MTKKVLGNIKRTVATLLAALTLTATMASTASASVRPVIPVSIEMAGMSKVNATSHNFTVKAMNKVGIVGADVNVRTKPWVNDGSEVIGALGKGQKVKVTGLVYKNNAPADWYRINFHGRTAYVSKSFSHMSFNDKPAPVPVKKVMTVKGVTNYLGVRSAKTIDDRYEIGRLYNGDKVRVLNSTDKTFYLVQGTATGVKGYVLAKYLK